MTDNECLNYQCKLQVIYGQLSMFIKANEQPLSINQNKYLVHKKTYITWKFDCTSTTSFKVRRQSQNEKIWQLFKHINE